MDNVSRKALIEWGINRNWQTWQDGKAFEEFVASLPTSESEGVGRKYRVAYAIHGYDGISNTVSKSSEVVEATDKTNAEKTVLESVRRLHRYESVVSLGVVEVLAGTESEGEAIGTEVLAKQLTDEVAHHAKTAAEGIRLRAENERLRAVQTGTWVSLEMVDPDRDGWYLVTDGKDVWSAAYAEGIWGADLDVVTHWCSPPPLPGIKNGKGADVHE